MVQDKYTVTNLMLMETRRFFIMWAQINSMGHANI